MAGVKHTVSIELQTSLATGLELYGTDGIQLVIAEPSWDVEYEADALPDDATPAWTKDQPDATGQTTSVAGGKFYLKDDGTGISPSERTRYTAPNWTGDLDVAGVTAYVRVKTLSNSDGAANDIDFRDGTSAAHIYIYPNKVVSTDTYNFTVTEADGYLEVWVVVKSNLINVWINPGTGWVKALTDQAVIGHGADWFAFGSGSGAGTSEAYWDFVRYIEEDVALLYPTTSPATTAGWTALDKGELDVSTALCVVYKDGYEDAEVQAESSTDVKVRYYANGGGASAWMTMDAFKALSDIEITDTTNSLKMETQYNSDGTYWSASRAQVMIDLTPLAAGAFGNQVF